MAWIWELAAEAATEQDAKAFLGSFDMSPVKVGDKAYPLHGFVTNEEGWWAVIIPQADSDPHPGSWLCGHGGPADAAEAALLTEVGNVLYQRLRKAYPYRFACVGVEVSGHVGFDEQFERLRDEADWVASTCDGLVVSEEVWKAAGSPQGFSSFSDGDLWIPWKGEPLRG